MNKKLLFLIISSLCIMSLQQASCNKIRNTGIKTIQKTKPFRFFTSSSDQELSLFDIKAEEEKI